MVESGRKHGPFDFRYPVAQKTASHAWDLQQRADGQEILGWDAFVARFVPNRQRHDFEALARYEAYRNATAQHSARAARAESEQQSTKPGALSDRPLPSSPVVSGVTG